MTTTTTPSSLPVRSSSRCSGVGLDGRRLEQPGDAPHLGAHPGGSDNRLPASVGRGGAAEHHVAAIAERHVVGNRRGVFRDRQALAGECRLRRLQRRRLDQPAVGRKGVAFLDEDDVARHERRRRYAVPLPAANHRGIGRGHRPKGRHGRFGARFLHEAHHRIQEHDGTDRERLVRQGGVAFHGPDRRGDGGGDQQQDDEHVLELRQEPQPGRHRFRRGQLVRAVFGEAGVRLFVGEPAPRIRPERGEHIAGRQPIGANRPSRFRGGRGHGSAPCGDTDILPGNRTCAPGDYTLTRVKRSAAIGFTPWRPAA